jgi:hypothetical protein
MRNIEVITRFTTLVVIGSLIVGTSWMLPGGAEARRARGGTRSSVNVHGGSGHHHHHVGAVVAAAVVTGLVVGSMVAASSIPPSCGTVVVNGVGFRQCDGYWYQPQYSGTQVTYVVVNPPQ